MGIVRPPRRQGLRRFVVQDNRPRLQVGDRSEYHQHHLPGLHQLRDDHRRPLLGARRHRRPHRTSHPAERVHRRRDPRRGQSASFPIFDRLGHPVTVTRRRHFNWQVSPLCFLKSLAALAPFSVGIRNGVSLGILSLGSCCLLSVVAAARRHRRHPSSCFAVPAAYCSPAASLASASRTPTSCLACLASFSRRVIELAGYADVPEITPYRASGFPRFMHCHLFF